MAKKSMIQREIKRIKLNQKYSPKRKRLIAEWKAANGFAEKNEST